jgi:parallel beta-helix repeat protein
VNDVDATNMVDGKPIYYWINERDMTVPLDAGCVILYNCQNIRAENLTLNNNLNGMIMADVTDSVIVGNNVTNNRNSGIWLIESSGNCFHHNNFMDNSAAVWFNWAEGNQFHHNNFMRSVRYQAYTQTWKNVWDDGYPSGGNYWSTYSAKSDTLSGPFQNSTGADGIQDTPKTIDENNTDNFPLMAPISVFEVGTWNGTVCKVDVVSNSTISDFTLDATWKTICFNVTGEYGLGFCRTIVPNNVVEGMWHGNYTVLLNEQPVQFRNWTAADDTYIYFAYQHSEHEVTIVPEYPSLPVLQLFAIATLCAVIVYRKAKISRARAREVGGMVNHGSSSRSCEKRGFPIIH